MEQPRQPNMRDEDNPNDGRGPDSSFNFESQGNASSYRGGANQFGGNDRDLDGDIQMGVLNNTGRGSNLHGASGNYDRSFKSAGSRGQRPKEF